MTSKKLICVVGATGKQGGSVAKRFHDAGYQVHALTRTPSSPASQTLAAQGITPVEADLEDLPSLIAAFKGANVIFSVTNYWEPFFKPEVRQRATELDVSSRKLAYEIELQQGKNIADAAAATLGSLDENGFLVSTLSHAGQCSQGRFTEVYHFDAKAEVFPKYVQETYPELARKMSCIHTGYFFTSFNILPKSYLGRLADGIVQMAFTTAPDKLIPHLDPVGDMGNFTYAVSQMAPGKAYLAAGTMCSWTEWITIFGEITGLSVSYRQVTDEEMIAMTGDRETGIEVAQMFSYSSDPGYNTGTRLLTAQDIRDAGIECPMTSWREWASRYNWSSFFTQQETSHS